MAMETRPTNGASRTVPAVVIVMGVSGSGNSTVGGLLASRLRWEFEDADWFHPAANVEKMHNGVPLTDEDRWPWLGAIAAWIDKSSAGHGVIACSALKRCYRDDLVGDRADVRLVYIKGDEPLPGTSISCRGVCSTVSMRRSRSQDRTRIPSWYRSSRHRGRSSPRFYPS
jgi:gluconokinase